MKVSQSKCNDELLISKMNIHELELKERILKAEHRIIQEETQKQKQAETSELRISLLESNETLQNRKFELKREVSKLNNELNSQTREVRMIQNKKKKLEGLHQECKDGGEEECFLEEISTRNKWAFNCFCINRNTMIRRFDTQITRAILGDFGVVGGGVGSKYIELSLGYDFDDFKDNESICRLFTKRSHNKSYQIKLSNLEKSLVETRHLLSEKENELVHLSGILPGKLERLESEINEINFDLMENNIKFEQSFND